MFHVKHPGRQTATVDVLAGIAAGELSELGVKVPARAVTDCCNYLLHMLRENESVNLTAVVDPFEAVRLHVVDSLAVLPLLEAAPEGTLLDIGTGGGFPGVALAIASQRSTILLDSSGKKLDAVRRALSGSAVRPVPLTVHARAEEYARDHPGDASFVVARAVAELPVLLEYAAPLMAPGGHFVAMKGTLASRERSSGDAAARLLGLRPEQAVTYALPGRGETRTAAVYIRVAEPSVRLPRRPGRAAKSPLG